MTLAASRAGVVGSVVAAALTVCTVVMPSAVAALNIGVGPCWGVACGDMLEAMARITPSQPNDAMARIASRRNRTVSLDPNLPGQNSRERFFRRRFKLLSKILIDSKEDWARKGVRCDHYQSVRQIAQFAFRLAAIFPTTPVVRRLLK